MKGHENKKKYPIPITDHGHGGKMVRLERKKCMPCVVARIYIVGSLVVLERGVRVRHIFNLAMENVLKGLPDKISCPEHHIVTVFVFVCLVFSYHPFYFDFHSARIIFLRVFRFLFMEHKQDYNVTSVKNVKVCF